MTLTDLLNKAVAAGVPAEQLEAVGFRHGEKANAMLADEWAWVTPGCWSNVDNADPAARAAAERVVIEWLVKGNLGVHIDTDVTGTVVLDLHAAEPPVLVDRPTLSAALLAVLDSIGGEG